MKKAYFQYYETFEKIVQKFNTADDRDQLRMKIINYGLYGTEPTQLTDKESMVWEIIKDMIDDQVHRREVNRRNREMKKAVSEQKTNNNEKNETEQKKRFVRPTVQEVAAYCQERTNGINAQQFVDFYEARGWRIGNSTMKDWKAAVRTWEQRRRDTGITNNEWPEGKLTL